MAPSASSSARGAVTAGATFRRAAVEVDDVELSIIFVPQRCPPIASAASLPAAAASARAAAVSAGKPDSCRPEPTHSTRASTAADACRSQDNMEVWPPPWVQHNRLVLSREGINSFQVWPVTGNGRCVQAEKLFCADSSSPWPHLVEVIGTPHGAPQAMSILLALPSAMLASRVVEALSKVRRRKGSRLPTGPTTARGAFRCELHINAKLNLDAGMNSVNCAAVVRRGISEACHVGADRVRICSVRDGAGTDGRLRISSGTESSRSSARPRSTSDSATLHASMAQSRCDGGSAAAADGAAELPVADNSSAEVGGGGTCASAAADFAADAAATASAADAAASAAAGTEGSRSASASKELASQELAGNGSSGQDSEGAPAGAAASTPEQLPQQPEAAECAISEQP